jgi:hypothetical protein
MQTRNISEDAVVAVLAGPRLMWHDPKEGSMVLTGVDEDGRELVVYVVGDHWPMAGRLTIKSTAWRDDE